MKTKNTNNKLSGARRLTILKNRLEKLANKTEVSTEKVCEVQDNEIRRSLDDELGGFFLFGEGYENISWPGTANVSQYRLYIDGVLKIDLFMDEEYSTIRSIEKYDTKTFIDYLKRKPRKSFLECHNNVSEALREEGR